MLAVRQKIGEITPNFFSDQEILDELNVSARRMCSAAQSINSFATFNTQQLPDGNWAQEYALPDDVDLITGAAYFSGSLFPLTPVPRESVQLGGYVPGLPTLFYIKKNSKILTPQIAGGSISGQAMNPLTTPRGKMVVGLYPVPQAALPIYIWFLQWHHNLEDPLDECEVPDRFKIGWVSYAVARMKEKESAFDEAQYYDAQHDKYTQDYVEYQITNGQEISPPSYSNRPLPPYFLRGSNVLVVVAQNPGTTNM